MKVTFAFFEQFIDISGGIEHVCCNLANALTKRGYEISIVYCYGKSGKAFFPLNKEVKLYNLMAMHPKKWKSLVLGKCISLKDKTIREIIRVFSKSRAREWNESVKGRMIQNEIQEVISEISPDLIISYRYETSNYLLNFAKIDIPVITMFHINPEIAFAHAPKGELMAIQKSACAQVLMKSDIEKVRKFCPRANIRWISNAVPQYEQCADLGVRKKHYKIINVARLNKPQKRQHLLIEAFSKLAADFPEWTVEFWGGGDDTQYTYAEELKNLILNKSLEHRIFLMGNSKNIINEYVKTDIFAFPSAYEGFPLAMTEAMSAGLPVVAYRSCPAVNELIRDGETGLLVDDGIDALAEGLKKLMEDQELRERMGRAAHESMKEFAPEKIWDQWEALMQDVIAKHKAKMEH